MTIYPKIKQDLGVDSKYHTAVIDVVGVIAEGKDANATDIIESLRDAVKDNNQRHYSALKFAGWQPCAIGLCL